MILRTLLFYFAFFSIQAFGSGASLCQSVHQATEKFYVRSYLAREQTIKSVSSNGETLSRSSRMMWNEYPDGYIGFLVTPQQQDESVHAARLAEGIQETHRSYGDRLSQSEKQLVMASDWSQFGVSLTSERLGYAAVRMGNQTVGFLRAYDGTGSPTPAELLLTKKNIQTDFFQTQRSKGLRIFELGKYFLNSDLKPQDRKIVRNELFRWLLETYLKGDSEQLSKRIFIIDVSSLAHARAYQKMFGAEIVNRSLFVPPLNEVDFIMTVEASVLKDHLIALINSN